MRCQSKISYHQPVTPRLLTSRLRNCVSRLYRDLTNSLHWSIALTAMEVAGIPGTFEEFNDTAFRRIRPAAVGREAPRIERGSEEEALEVSWPRAREGSTG